MRGWLTHSVVASAAVIAMLSFVVPAERAAAQGAGTCDALYMGCLGVDWVCSPADAGWDVLWRTLEPEARQAPIDCGELFAFADDEVLAIAVGIFDRVLQKEEGEPASLSCDNADDLGPGCSESGGQVDHVSWHGIGWCAQEPGNECMDTNEPTHGTIDLHNDNAGLSWCIYVSGGAYGTSCRALFGHATATVIGNMPHYFDSVREDRGYFSVATGGRS